MKGSSFTLNECFLFLVVVAQRSPFESWGIGWIQSQEMMVP